MNVHIWIRVSCCSVFSTLYVFGVTAAETPRVPPALGPCFQPGAVSDPKIHLPFCEGRFPAHSCFSGLLFCSSLMPQNPNRAGLFWYLSQQKLLKVPGAAQCGFVFFFTGSSVVFMGSSARAGPKFCTSHWGFFCSCWVLTTNVNAEI